VITSDFSQRYGEILQEEWVAPRTRLAQRYELPRPGGEINEDNENEEMRDDDGDTEPEILRKRERRQDAAAQDRDNPHPRIDSAMIVQQDGRAAMGDSVARRSEFIWKRDEHDRMTEGGVNIPRVDAQQMRKIKRDLTDLFRHVINPLKGEFRATHRDWDGWLAFEGASEESMNLIRKHIMQELNRDGGKLYGVKTLNPKLHEARESTTEMIQSLQQIRNTLRKLKKILEEITETEEDEAGSRRRHAKLTIRLGAIVNLVTPERMREIFNTEDQEAI
jgi:hypothetical protein